MRENLLDENNNIREYKVNMIDELRNFVRWAIINDYYLIAHNGSNFDDVILNYIMTCNIFSYKILFNIVHDIIYDVTYSKLLGRYRSNIEFKRIDSMNVLNLAFPAPRSLKLAASSAEFYNIEDFDFENYKTIHDYNIMIGYLANDVEALEHICEVGKDQFEIKHMISNIYNIDLLNKDNSGISNVLFPKLYSDATNIPIRDLKAMYTERDIIEIEDVWPQNIKFKHEDLVKIETILKRKSVIGYEKLKLHVEPFVFNKLPIQLGAGGIHSEDGGAIFEEDIDKGIYIIDVDGTSFYPKLMTVYLIYPEHLGMEFITEFERMIDLRIIYKFEGKKGEAYVFKIILNSTFGKMNANFPNWLKDSKAALATTLSGQITLLKNIEMASEIGIIPISCNTDGVTYIIKRDQLDEFDRVMKQWSALTSINLEYVRYRKYIRLAVNDYIAESYSIPEDKDPDVYNKRILDSIKDNIKYKLKRKRKGSLNQFSHKESMVKSLSNPIIPKAVENYLFDNIPVEQTIRDEDNIINFSSCNKIDKKFRVESHSICVIDDNDFVNTLTKDDIYYESNGNIIRYFVSASKNSIKIYKEKKHKKKNINKRKDYYSKSELLVGYRVEIINKILNFNAKNYEINYDYYIKKANEMISKIKYEDRYKFKNKNIINGQTSLF